MCIQDSKPQNYKFTAFQKKKKQKKNANMIRDSGTSDQTTIVVHLHQHQTGTIFQLNQEHLQHLIMKISWEIPLCPGQSAPHPQHHLIPQRYKQLLRFLYQSNKKKINIDIIIHIKVFIHSTTWLQPFQIFCKYVFHILNTCCMCFLGNSSLSETIDYCAWGYTILGLGQHTHWSKIPRLQLHYQHRLVWVSV